MTRASVRVKSRLVTGVGAVALNAPMARSAVVSQATIATQSSTWIHGMYWSPDPSVAPSPSLKGTIIFLSAPPLLPSTTPVRRRTRRVLAGTALASCSQSTHNWARKSGPGGVPSVTGSAPQAP